MVCLGNARFKKEMRKASLTSATKGFRLPVDFGRMVFGALLCPGLWPLGEGEAAASSRISAPPNRLVHCGVFGQATQE